jgi:hypothetical protein
MEINENLLKDYQLLVRSPEEFGYLCLINPTNSHTHQVIDNYTHMVKPEDYHAQL